jgi:hypothetical protein
MQLPCAKDPSYLRPNGDAINQIPTFAVASSVFRGNSPFGRSPTR